MRSACAALGTLLCFALPLRVAASPESAAIVSIDALCAARSEQALVREPVRFGRIFGDPSTTSSAWRATDDAMLERIARDPNIYSELADVWRDAGAVAVVNIESRSLEFREHASYCFRVDGTLARVNSTSSGTVNIDEETRYFGSGGELVAQSSRMGLLYPQPGETISPDLRPSKPTIFTNARALPFFSLMTPE